MQFHININILNREPVDKIYFRRRDEESKYAECKFMSKVLLTKR